MPFTSGLQIGPYRIMEQLGQGGMATVYKAYHASLDRYVAVKVLHQAFIEGPNYLPVWRVVFSGHKFVGVLTRRFFITPGVSHPLPAAR